MRKAAFCICKNKGSDQLHSNCAADQRLCFCLIDSTIPLLPKPLSISSDCTAYFVGHLEDRFSHDAAHIMHVKSKGCGAII